MGILERHWLALSCSGLGMSFKTMLIVAMWNGTYGTPTHQWVSHAIIRYDLVPVEWPIALAEWAGGLLGIRSGIAPHPFYIHATNVAIVVVFGLEWLFGGLLLERVIRVAVARREGGASEKVATPPPP